jgi:hypothetical protein
LSWARAGAASEPTTAAAVKALRTAFQRMLTSCAG